MIQIQNGLHIRIPAALVAAAALLVLARPAFGQCGELVTNGDFEQGNSAFLSQYFYSPNDILNEGTYDVTSTPTVSHYCYGGVDHTSGAGKLMVVNGSVAVNRVLWSQTVPVLAGTNYRLSAWVNSHCGAINRAVLSFRVNGVQVGANYFAPATTFNWAQYTGVWNSGANATATIEIVDLNLAPGGNDFGMDDISFMKIDETAPVITTVSGLEMWTPNHIYHTFTLSQMIASLSDDCDNAPTVFIRSAGSDEVENAVDLGDGDTWDDIVIAPDCQSVQLRSERQGEANGRVYTVFIRAEDASGNSTTVACKIAVRHSIEQLSVDDGVAAGYLVSGSCGAAPKIAFAPSVPSGFTLEQNFPNPFNPSTEIRYSLMEETELRLSVLDHLGREVRVLAEGTAAAGTHAVTFDAGDFPSGIYFYRLESALGMATKKMMLMK